jgi:hypothetical protein
LCACWSRYYLWTSGCDGWAPTTIHLYTADSPLGSFNRSGLNNSRGWLIGWQPLPIPPPGTPGNRVPDQPGKWAFGSQSTYILAVRGPFHPQLGSLTDITYATSLPVTEERVDGSGQNPKFTPDSDLAPFIYMADRWEPGTPAFGTYVWLPLFIDPANASRVRVEWHASWRLDNATSPFS